MITVTGLFALAANCVNFEMRPFVQPEVKPPVQLGRNVFAQVALVINYRALDVLNMNHAIQSVNGTKQLRFVAVGHPDPPCVEAPNRIESARRFVAYTVLESVPWQLLLSISRTATSLE